MPEFFPSDGVIELPHGTLLRDMFKNCGTHGAVIVEDVMEVRFEDFHVLRSIGCLGSIGESHCHVCHLVGMR